jgi:hypothetical protein
MTDEKPSDTTQESVPTKSGLPGVDRASWEKGFSDGIRGHTWWPGPETEPLSYAAGYSEAQAQSEAGAKRP